MKKTTVGDCIYQGEDGSFWVRPNIGGVRTWRKLKAGDLRQAKREGREYLYLAEKAALQAKVAQFGISECKQIPTCLETVSSSLIEVKLPPSLQSALYFLMAGHECVYVGQTTQEPLMRVYQHPDKKFDRILILPTAPDLLKKMEKLYIQELRPKYNVRHSPGARLALAQAAQAQKSQNTL